MKPRILPSIALLAIIAISSWLLNAKSGPNSKGISGKKVSAGSSFDEYWYQGKAELTSYTLEQARYGEIHEGSAVLVYVTENFDPIEQTKADDPRKERVPVLKLNNTREFNTGVYPYSLMMSVFTPVNLSKSNFNTIKVTTSVQEWCGHMFMQFSNQSSGYGFYMNSYFENEGEQSKDNIEAILEDEIWNLIRINPESLPEGEVAMVPGSYFLRLKHKEAKAYKANLSKETSKGEIQYKVSYPELDRTLSIRFEAGFPYKILGWEEKYVSGWGAGKKVLATKAKMKESILLDYWNHNHPEDDKYRKMLKLP